MPIRRPLLLRLCALAAPLALLGLAQSAPAQTASGPAATPAARRPAPIGATPAKPPLTTPRAPIPYAKLYPQAHKPATATGAVATAGAAKPAAAGTPAAAAVDAAQLEPFVDGVVHDAMTEDHLAGVAVVIVQNGQVLVKKGYGVDRLSPRRAVDPDRTLFRIGSISKTFTWIAMDREIEAGRMRLDAPVNLYLPERLQIKDQGFKTPVRLRDLMTHTGGFEDRTLGQLFERDWRRVRPLNLYLRQEQPRRVREPGQIVSYSNYGAALAGSALANVQGKTYERLIEDEILVPAGLSHTTFREPRPERPDLPQPMTDAMAANVSEGFGWQGGQFAPRDFEYIGQLAPAGAASSTAADMGRYMTLLLGGGVIDGRTIYSPVVDKALHTSLYSPGPTAAGWTAGLEDLPLPGGRRGLGHAGDTFSFHAKLVLIPSMNMGVFVATNSEGGGSLAENLAPAVVRQLAGPPAGPPPSVSPPPASAHVYAGRYLTTRRAYAGLEAFVDRLVGRALVQPRDDGSVVVTIDDKTAAYLPAAEAGLFRNADGDAEPLVFHIDDSGRADTLFAPWGGAAYQRQGPLDSLTLMTILATGTILAALATIGGVLAAMTGMPGRQTLVQSRAALSQTLQSVLLLIAFVCFAIWGMRASDRLRLIYEWPGALIITASACTLVAGILSVLNLVLLPIVWRGGRRVDSWTVGRKLRFSVSALLFVAFTVLVGLWGGLTPWIS